MAGPPRYGGDTHRPTTIHTSPSGDGAHTGRRATMQRMGVDLHKRESQLAINAADGTIRDSEWGVGECASRAIGA